jgi:hypothetical protein
MNSYITVHDYARAVTGQGITSLLGNLMRVGTGGVTLGATTLPVTPNTTVQLNQYDQITIFDGASSEIVTVGAAGASVGASSIPISACAFAHAAGTSCCSDGTGPQSLAEAILEGSASVEQICRQALLQATYTSESLPLASTRAWVDSSLRLGIRPRQFPVQSVSAITVIFNLSTTLSLDTSQAITDSIARIVTLPVIKTIAGSGNTLPFSTLLDGTVDGFVQISYVAGYTYGALPLIIKRATTLLTSDILSDRYNPTGVASNQEGKRRIDAFLRGDLSGESALVKRARHWLKPFIQDAI